MCKLENAPQGFGRLSANIVDIGFLRLSLASPGQAQHFGDDFELPRRLGVEETIGIRRISP